MSGKNYYYLSGNTAQGLISFSESNLAGLTNVFFLNHPSESLKTELISKVIKHYEGSFDLEIIKSVNGHEFLDGVVIRDKSLAVISQPVKSENITEIDLRNGTDVDECKDLHEKKISLTNAAYQAFDAGLHVHDELEKIYINEMDFAMANQVANDFISKVLPSIVEREGHIYHRLFGTNTKDGVVNVVPELINSVSKAYFIKGRAGTGKSTFMKKLANACKDNGYKVELYHCSFDSNSIDMVLVRELDFCIFDSTDPHEFFPERVGDEIVDLYEKLVTPGTDEKFSTEINELNNRYKSYMQKGIAHLQEAGLYHSKLEENYKSVNQTDINEITDYMYNQIK
ncbi:hypothetical protein CFK37_11410 [Virgibacillus phasianinus]|uniref:ATPase n=1 Tax=Virgibacillus phasianinus TaxID=2017483 RepID=A0A220U462_9BACI|nr:hypothetical protein [Virgibacillus phasianinus]ASK62706.1 hypothetical protein CFK37_11410 [Virgibacillus phasianinus]